MNSSDVPEGTPWWIGVIFLFLVGGGGGGALLLRSGMAQVPGIWGALARRRQEKAEQRRKAEEESPSERVTNAEIKRLEKRYNELARDYEEDKRKADERAEAQERRAEAQERRLDDLERRITVANNRFFVLLGYTRLVIDVVRRLDANHPLPEVPPDLQEWLGHG
ncbi:hypothetical protein FK268_12510 [Tsukamurella sputi]|uniref:Uncharacterized protein n=1 Tax=Tsukamurella sputi TaxID=2591848 RepID=A0A5C5RN37_9ACTN|nr:hypothetical protein [Tsukamurella sputi]TWS24406.1 hypothetical protein FK268_12510 [Tsukamurella sputi]